MNAIQRDTTNLCYREAFDDLAKKNDKTYVPQEQIELERVTDRDRWQPDERIRELIPNIDQIEIELIEPTTDLNAINEHLIKQECVGLVLLGPKIDRGNKPIMIVMTIKDKFYVIDPDDVKRGVQFLKMKLLDKKLQFYTSNGKNESDCLYHHYGIKLWKTNAICCTGLHIRMMQTIKYLPDTARLLYPVLARMAACMPKNLYLPNFSRMTEIWLDVNKATIRYDKAQLQHLASRPLSITAINVIKKRCALVILLAKELEHFSWLEATVMSEGTFLRLAECPGYCRSVMEDLSKESMKRGYADAGHFPHYNSAFKVQVDRDTEEENERRKYSGRRRGLMQVV